MIGLRDHGRITDLERTDHLEVAVGSEMNVPHEGNTNRKDPL
jgi:hypothetical protein